jgi:hypothetical protein
MSDGSRLLLIGLRGSGKTSYLAALWHLVETGELPTALVTSQLQPDRHYLNGIRDSWLKFREVGRTSLRSQEVLSLLLRDTQTDTPINLTVPDHSGELFRLQWVTRKATRQYAEFAGRASGVLLFIHPLGIEKAPRIASLAEHQASRDAEQSPQDNDEKVREWSPDFAPTQVKLVELLQFVNYLRSSNKLPSIAVVISAWDVVRDQVLPSFWLDSHLPLLSQFLTSNADAAPFQVFGVSALGGDLQKDVERLQNEDVPSRRIKVVENKLQSHNDLTAPIRFLLESDKGRTKAVGQ